MSAGTKLKSFLIYTAVFLFAGLLFLVSCNPPVLERRLGDWKHRSGYPGLSRSGAVVFVIGTNAYVGTGYDRDNETYLQDFSKYDAVSNTWTSSAPFPGIGRQNAVAFSVNGIGYVGTGVNGTARNTVELNDFYAYDPGQDKWTRVADLPGGGRRNALAFVVNNHAYVGTGLSTSASGILNGHNDFYKYDAAANTWTLANGYPGPKIYSAFSFVINNEAYVGGGLVARDASYNNSFWKYNEGLDIWEKRPNIDSLNSIVKRAECASFSSGGLGYIVCGSPATASNTIFEFNPANYIWSQKTDIEAPSRASGIGFAIPDLKSDYPIFFGLGAPSPDASPYSDFWSFNPTQTKIQYN